MRRRMTINMGIVRVKMCRMRMRVWVGSMQ